MTTQLDPTSRRDFLATAALIGAGVAVAPAAFAATSAQKNSSTEGKNTMPTRKLGSMEVSALGAGAMSISANYGPPADRAQGIRALRMAHERGVTFFCERRSGTASIRRRGRGFALSEVGLVLSLNVVRA